MPVAHHRLAAILMLAPAASFAQAPSAPATAPVTTSAPASRAADTVFQPAQGSAVTPAARANDRVKGSTEGRDVTPGQSHETHGSPNPRNPDPR